MSADGETRAQLKEALWSLLSREVYGVTSGSARMALPGIDPDALTDALLPLVQRIASERAAESVRWAFIDAGDEALTLPRRRPTVVADWLLDFGQDRAAALRAAS